MSKFVGIDLGTTNSAICSYDGETIHLYKSPEQNDVTPSAIFIDRRGNKFVGLRAYNNAPRNPDSAAVLFKRLIGTKTPINLTAINKVTSPEECSAEILRTLFGYLPEAIRNDIDTGTVITVPAAFNQMQKDATLSAAEMAGLGKIALMQEPVAAVMAVMRERKSDGMFMVYDFGGGTLDIAIAQSVAGRVSLLAHGGISMCGGRDFDRAVVDQVVKPWLLNTFNLPENFAADPKYRTLVTLATWASERAKIELSTREEAVIAQAETELGVRDASGAEIYLDIPLSRQTLDRLIAGKVDESIQAARETLEKAGLSSQDIERIVFVGGPTHYKPMRDKVASELGIAAATDVNPMIAVAQGAAIFAESIDWSSQKRGRKSSRGTLATGAGLDVSFNFSARTPDVKAKLVVKIGGQAVAGAEFQIDSMDTGWSSGRVALRDGATVNLPLGKAGDNVFKIFLFDGAGGPLSIENSRIVIARTAATIDAIPASSSIGIEALDKVGGRPVLVYLVRQGDALPKKGTKEFKAAEILKSGAAQSLVFRIWEGEIEEPVTDNRFVGVLEVRGTDFENNVIQAGATLVCEYEVLDSGNIVLKVSVPSIAGTFHSDRNFYSRQVGEVDFFRAEKQILEEVRQLQERAKSIGEKVSDARIDQVLDKLDEAGSTGDLAGDPESAKQALERVQEAKKLVAQVRKDNLPTMRQLDLDRCIGVFESTVREHARPAEVAAFENLVRTAKRSIEKGSSDFEIVLDEMRAKNFQIMWRQDWFVVDRFKWLAEEPWQFSDRNEHAQLVQAGRVALQSDDFDKLRAVLQVMEITRMGSGGAEDMLTMANIVKA